MLNLIKTIFFISLIFFSSLCHSAVVRSSSGGSSSGATNVGIGTATNILVYTSSTTAGPSNNVIITNSGNVGIGFAAPASQLQIGTGGSKFTSLGSTPGIFMTSSFIPDLASINSALIMTRSDGVSTGGITSYEDSSSSNMAITARSIIRAVNQTNNNTLIDDNGNMGIGSAWPGERLDLFSSNQRFVTSGTGIKFGTDNKAAINSSAATTPDIRFLTNGSETMRIANSGNVGIGTTTPAGALTVMGGNVGIGTWVPAEALTIGAGGVIRLQNTGTGYGTIQGTTAGITIDASNSSTGAVTFTSSGTSLGVNSNLGGSPIYTGFNQTAGQNLVFRAAAGNGIGFIPNIGSGADFTTTAMFIASNKNVGIGTWLPASALEVKGSAVVGQGPSGGNAYVTITGGTQESRLTLINNAMASSNQVWRFGAGTTSGGGAPTNTFNIQRLTDNGASILETALWVGASQVGFFPNGASAGGNVGIGTAVPRAEFDVTPNLATNSPFVVTSVGNVGIGSTAPQATLDLGTSGTLRSNRTTGIGFTEKNGSNTACNTTCGASACVFGFDQGTLGAVLPSTVSCTDATADDCVCAGP